MLVLAMSWRPVFPSPAPATAASARASLIALAASARSEGAKRAGVAWDGEDRDTAVGGEERGEGRWDIGAVSRTLLA